MSRMTTRIAAKTIEPPTIAAAPIPDASSR